MRPRRRSRCTRCWCRTARPPGAQTRRLPAARAPRSPFHHRVGASDRDRGLRWLGRSGPVAACPLADGGAPSTGRRAPLGLESNIRRSSLPVATGRPIRGDPRSAPARSTTSRSAMHICTPGDRGALGGPARKLPSPSSRPASQCRSCSLIGGSSAGHRTNICSHDDRTVGGWGGRTRTHRLDIQSVPCWPVTPLPSVSPRISARLARRPVPSSPHGRAFYGPHHGRRPGHSHAFGHSEGASSRGR